MSERILRKTERVAIALGMAVLLTPSSANANMRLELAVGTSSYTGTVLTDTANSGVLTFSGAIGVFTTNVTTGSSSPPLGPPPGDNAQLDLNTLNISTPNAGTITIILENAGFVAPTGTLTAQGDIGGTISNGTAIASSFVGTTNVVPTLPADQAVGPISAPPSLPASGGIGVLALTTSSSSFSNTESATFSNAGTYSLYQEIVVTFGTGGGTFSADFANTVLEPVATPEPSTMAIAGLGALGMIGYGLRRRKAKGA
jgi:hypothetical protein